MGKLYVVGLGPGGAQDMTLRAMEVLNACDLIVGYRVYVDLIRERFSDKELLSTPMGRETERVRLALSRAEEGRSVALVCSGDAGVYGLSGPALELAGEYPEVEVEIVPGISAALSGGAALGAPLMNDFAVISLSDLMTPWEVIEQRLDCGARGDFVLCLYNPGSPGRREHLRRACDILLRTRSARTVCALVRNIGRGGESRRTLTLGELRETEADMFTTVFIGNSQTKLVGGCMVTPRGYRL